MNVELFASELERDEEVRLKPYVDSVGKVTIGIGRNLTDDGISLDEAKYLLKDDIERTLEDLSYALPWWIYLDEVRQHVLANMCFNLGISRLLGFKKMLAALKSHDFETAADEMAASNWDREVGERAVRLVAAMRTGHAEAVS